MQSFLPFLYGADGKFSILGLLAFVALVALSLFIIKKVPPLKSAVGA